MDNFLATIFDILIWIGVILFLIWFITPMQTAAQINASNKEDLRKMGIF